MSSLSSIQFKADAAIMCSPEVDARITTSSPLSKISSLLYLLCLICRKNRFINKILEITGCVGEAIS